MKRRIYKADVIVAIFGVTLASWVLLGVLLVWGTVKGG